MGMLERFGEGKGRSLSVVVVLLLGLFLWLGTVPAFAVLVDGTTGRLPADLADSYNFALGDVDGDTDADLFVANANDSRLLLNDGAGTFSDQTSLRLPPLQGTIMAGGFSDLDGDGDLDLLLANAAGQNHLLINDGDGTFTDGSEVLLPENREVSMAVAVADVDRDGYPDAVVANKAGQNRLLINDGSGNFTDETSSRLPAANDDSYDIELDDFNGDGFVDLLIGNHGTQNRLLLNNGLGVFIDATAGRLPTAEGSTIDVRTGDLDADGDLDLLLAEGAEGLRFLVNDGTGIFADESAARLPALTDFVVRADVADLDDDGDLDLMLANLGQNRVFLNDGNGSFTDATASLLPANSERTFGLVLADTNSDLDHDAALAIPQGQNRLLVNDLSFPRIRLGVAPDYIEVGDAATVSVAVFDEDGIASTELTINAAPVSLVDGSASYLPGTAGEYIAAVTSVDNSGASATREVAFLVQSPDVVAPEVTLTVDGPASLIAGQTVQLHVSASDDRKVAGTSLSINGQTVLLDASGNASFTTTLVGDYTAIATATDPAGNQGQATLTFSALPDTEAPTLELMVAPDPVDVRTPTTISVNAADNIAVSALTLSVSGPSVPGGLTLALDALGEASYTPYLPGTYTLTSEAIDPSGNTTTQTATFEAVGTADTTAPLVTLTVDRETVMFTGSVLLTVQATDDIGVALTSLSINGTAVTLDAFGTASYTADAIGDYTAVAEAQDATGNVGTASTTFAVIDPATDTTPPVVAIETPTDLSEVTHLVDIAGSINDDTLVSYRLEYAPLESDTFVTIATGHAPVNGAVLGTLDTTMLTNGMVKVRLSAEDYNGATASDEAVYLVAGGAKVGIVRLSFNDLTIPVAGIPITITRTYDSRVKTAEDFGVGWTLDVRQGQVEHNRIPGEGWSIVPSGGFFPLPCQVVNEVLPHMTEVRLSEREYYRFRLTLFNIAPTTGGCVADVGFEFVDGTVPGAQLGIVGNTSVFYSLGTTQLIDDSTFQVYNPRDVRLTTIDGRIFDFERAAGGITRIEDPNGNQIFINDDGIVHSSGKSISFERDGAGRIVRITDPMGHTLNYDYDAAGDLVGFTNQEGHTTSFTYNTTHDLIDIIDPRGVQAMRSEYDADGRLIATIDAEGNRIEYDHYPDSNQEFIWDALGNYTVLEYCDRGNVIARTNALGHTTTYSYDADDNLLSETNPLGHTPTYTYDERGNQLTVTDPLGNVTTNTYDGNKNLLTTTDPLDNVTTNTYDTRGNLLSTTAPDNTTTHFTYDASGNPRTVSDAANNLTTFTYDAAGNLMRRTDAAGYVTNYTYDANGNRLTETTTYTTPTGVRTVTTRWEYNAINRVIKETDAEGNVTLTEYDALGTGVATVDALGRRTEFVYDPRGLLAETVYPDDTPGIDADNPRTVSVYDAAGREVTTIDELGHETHFVFDAVGQLVETVYPDDTPANELDNPRTITEYDAAGQVTAQIDERGNRTEFIYDNAGRQTGVRDALGNETVTVYDVAGRQDSQVDALSRTTSFSYDATGRPKTTTFADGTSSAIAYDEIGQVRGRTDQAGRTTGFEYDALGRLTAVVDALGQRTEYGYDEMGNLVRQTDANDNVTRYEYDALGRRVATVLPLGQRSTTSYDAVGSVASTTDFNGQTLTYVYDERNRLIEKRFFDGSVETFSYADNGLRLTAEDTRGTTTWTYDQRDRLESRRDPDGSTIAYSYDAAGNRSSVTIPSGITTYTYDALNRLETVTDFGANVTTYHYDAVSNLARTELPNNTVETRGYDELNRLLDLTTTGPSGIVVSYIYQLDAVGNRTTVTEHDGRRVEYTYDPLYRLEREAIFDLGGVIPSRAIDYTYDPVGNRLTRDDSSEGVITYAYDANDRLQFETLASDVTERTYDNNGNLLSQRKNGVDEVLYYWDQDNRLVRVDTNADGAVDVTNDYDVDGIRVAQTVNNEEMLFLIDRNRTYAQVLEEYTPGNSNSVSYVHGLDLLSQNRTADGINYEASFFGVDGLGSTRALTDVNGDVTNRYVYDAFGRTIMETGPIENVYLYAGEQRDFNVGLDYLRARYLDVGSGRFVSIDPAEGALADPVQRHRYLYAHINPVNVVDPTGLFSVSEVLSTITIANVLTVVLAANSSAVLAAGKTLNLTHKRAIEEAKVLMARAARELRSKEANIKRFKKWFGDPASRSRINSAARTFGKMLGKVERLVLRDHRLDPRGSKCNSTDGGAVGGYVYIGEKGYNIYACNPFLTGNMPLGLPQAGLIVHELAHKELKTSEHGYKDRGQGSPDVYAGLLVNDRKIAGTALQNPFSYTYFATEFKISYEPGQLKIPVLKK